MNKKYVYRELGLCICCGEVVPEDGKSKIRCPRCHAAKLERERKNAKIKKNNSKARQKLISMVEAIPKYEDLLTVKRETVPEKHNCNGCVWGRNLDDRIFCPFAEGTCLRYDPVFKAAVLDGSKHEYELQDKESDKESELIECNGGA